MNSSENWKIYNPSGKKRILVTRLLPGEEWLKILSDAGYRTRSMGSSGKPDQGRNY